MPEAELSTDIEALLTGTPVVLMTLPLKVTDAFLQDIDPIKNMNNNKAKLKGFFIDFVFEFYKIVWYKLYIK